MESTTPHRWSFTAQGRDEAFAYAVAHAVPVRMTATSPRTQPRGPVLHLTGAGTRLLATEHIRFTAPTAIEVGPLHSLLFSVGVRGAIQMTQGRHEEFVLRPGRVVVHPTEQGITKSWKQFEVHALQLPLDEVARVAAELSGIDPQALHFLAMAPVSASAARYWRALQALVTLALRDPRSPLSLPLVEQSAVQMLATTALVTFPNTTLVQQDQPRVTAPTPAAVRRAVAFIDSHLAEPVTLTDIAEAAGVTPRALQYAFQRHYELSPMAYLRRARLDAAHHELMLADPTSGVTVAEIAARWGFGRVDRFAALYRATYDLAPQHTLDS